MPQIGEFTRTKNGYTGHVRTLKLNSEIVLIPAEHSDAENAPDYRVHLATATGLKSAPAGSALARRPATTSPSRSTIRRSASRSAPTCSSRATRSPSGACTGTVPRSGRSGTEAMPIRSTSRKRSEAAGRRSLVRRLPALLLSGLLIAAPFTSVALAQNAPDGRVLRARIRLPTTSQKPRGASASPSLGYGPSWTRKAPAMCAPYRARARWA